jgi:hypothetical protein
MLLTLSTLSLLGSCSRNPGTDEAVGEPDELATRSTLDDPSTLDRATAVALTLQLEPDDARRPALIERLRQDGAPGLDALIDEYRRVPTRDTAEDAAWRALIDEVAQQRDAHYGGLFWYRELAQAQAVAVSSGKPILSLRLLGELTSEYSCANSRLFRTLLYADPELASWLADNFVMHWSSERPVPKIEIDFGDGRKIARTITGNSAHFVLDARGRTIDVIPGLMSTSSFRAALSDSLALEQELADTRNDARWRARLARHHERQFEANATRLADSLAQIRGLPQDAPAVRAWLARAQNPTRDRVPAIDAVPIAIGKSKVEAPILAKAPGQLGGRGRARAADWIAPDELELWMLGTKVAGAVALHPNSEAIIASEHPLELLVAAERRDEAAVALRQALIRSIEADTGKNVLELHARVHLELAARARDDRSLGFADVDEWLYAELFETPASDPWLGLVDPSVYTGLEAGGVIAQ